MYTGFQDHDEWNVCTTDVESQSYFLIIKDKVKSARREKRFKHHIILQTTDRDTKCPQSFPQTSRVYCDQYRPGCL